MLYNFFSLDCVFSRICEILTLAVNKSFNAGAEASYARRRRLVMNATILDAQEGIHY